MFQSLRVEEVRKSLAHLLHTVQVLLFLAEQLPKADPRNHFPPFHLDGCVQLSHQLLFHCPHQIRTRADVALDFYQFLLSPFAQKSVQFLLIGLQIEVGFTLLELLVGLEAVFGEGAVSLDEVFVGDQFVGFVLAEEAAVRADDLFVFDAHQVGLFGVQQAHLIVSLAVACR